MGRRKLGNPEKSSASFEHEINFGFDYCVIPEVWEGRRKHVRIWFLRQALERLCKIWSFYNCVFIVIPLSFLKNKRSFEHRPWSLGAGNFRFKKYSLGSSVSVRGRCSFGTW